MHSDHCCKTYGDEKNQVEIRKAKSPRAVFGRFTLVAFHRLSSWLIFALDQMQHAGQMRNLALQRPSRSERGSGWPFIAHINSRLPARLICFPFLTQHHIEHPPKPTTISLITFTSTPPFFVADIRQNAADRDPRHHDHGPPLRHRQRLSCPYQHLSGAFQRPSCCHKCHHPHQRLSGLFPANVSLALANTSQVPTNTSLVSMSTSPVPAPTPAVAGWTLRDVKRPCNKEDTKCDWSFLIDTHRQDNPPTSCTFHALRFRSDPASKSPFGALCGGRYRITGRWSGQFGPGNGFTTLSVVDEKLKLIAFPAYTDGELEDGRMVKPDVGFVTYTF